MFGNVASHNLMMSMKPENDFLCLFCPESFGNVKQYYHRHTSWVRVAGLAREKSGPKSIPQAGHCKNLGIFISFSCFFMGKENVLLPFPFPSSPSPWEKISLCLWIGHYYYYGTRKWVPTTIKCVKKAFFQQNVMAFPVSNPCVRVSFPLVVVITPKLGPAGEGQFYFELLCFCENEIKGLECVIDNPRKCLECHALLSFLAFLFYHLLKCFRPLKYVVLP